MQKCEQRTAFCFLQSVSAARAQNGPYFYFQSNFNHIVCFNWSCLISDYAFVLRFRQYLCVFRSKNRYCDAKCRNMRVSRSAAKTFDETVKRHIDLISFRVAWDIKRHIPFADYSPTSVREINKHPVHYAQLASKCPSQAFFRRAILTCKVGQTGLVLVCDQGSGLCTQD